MFARFPQKKSMGVTCFTCENLILADFFFTDSLKNSFSSIDTYAFFVRKSIHFHAVLIDVVLRRCGVPIQLLQAKAVCVKRSFYLFLFCFIVLLTVLLYDQIIYINEIMY